MYLVSFNHENTNDWIRTLDLESTDLDYKFSVMHKVHELLIDWKGKAVRDINAHTWQTFKTIYRALKPNYRTDLQNANVQRQKEWDTDSQIGPLFRAVELGGEVGEILNVVKKLERERMGIAGSRDTIEHLEQEIADGYISLGLIAMEYNIDVPKAIAKKFNSTSNANGLKTKLIIPV